jgi:hypothetical protein
MWRFIERIRKIHDEDNTRGARRIAAPTYGAADRRVDPQARASSDWPGSSDKSSEVPSTRVTVGLARLDGSVVMITCVDGGSIACERQARRRRR